MTRIEVIDSFEQFEALRDAWNDLAHRDDPPLPYLRHEWLASWWRGFGGEATLAIHVARDGSTLTAAAPLMRSRRSQAAVPVQALHSLGLNVGFADLLRDPARAGDLELLLRAALGDAHSDVVLARGTLAGSPKEAWMQAWLETERVAYETVRQGEFFLDTSRGVDDYRAARPSGLRHESDRRARQLAGRGEVRYERVSDSGAWEAALAEAFAVSLRSWKAREGSAIGQLPSFRIFLSELARRFGMTGEAELCLLRVGGQAIAFRMGVSDRDTFVDHEIAFDEAWARYSPGTLVALHSDQSLIRRGIREINLGFDFEWKKIWSPERRERLKWILYRRGSPAATAAHAARWVMGKLRRIEPGE